MSGKKMRKMCENPGKAVQPIGKKHEDLENLGKTAVKTWKKKQENLGNGTS